ncbi:MULTISPECIES: CpaD family pilus assembly protein [Rhizobium]|nr:CpaD family pilus assembly protein [Rhizobium sp. L51/94]TQX86559.1 pilus assembly protein CpaD [Rhizobium sp. rho-13.1]TQY12245.1 pilus assembly protein CpaD [Rhizobium sp. rho-1.1]
MTIRQSTNAERDVAMPRTRLHVLNASRLRMSSAALMVAVLAGCANHDDMTTGSVHDDYRQRHPIVLTQAEHNVDIPVAASDRRLTQGTRDMIRGFAQDYKAHATGTVEIMTPQGAMNSQAIADVRHQVRQELVASGIPSRRIADSFYPAGGAGDAAPIRLHFMATTAVTNACGQWPEDLADKPFDNQNYYNFGCASQSNLAAQVANPTDLVAPRAQTPIDAEQRGKVIESYRSGSTPTSSSSIGGFSGSGG